MADAAHEPPETSIRGHVNPDVGEQYAHERPEDDDEETNPAGGP